MKRSTKRSGVPARRRKAGYRGAVRRIPRAPRRYGSNNVVGGPNTCKIVETLPTVAILANQGYQFDIPGITGARPLAVAEQFALYRLAKVVLRFKPNFDTFTSNPAAVGGAGPVTVPTLYWKMNRFADAPAGFTSDDLRALGAKPLRFDDKQITVSYRPNILLDNASGGSHSGQVKMTPWLNTDSVPDAPGFNPSTTNHYGHFYLVECSVNGNGATPVGTVEATLIYEFKNPRVHWSSEHSSATVHVQGYQSLGAGGASMIPAISS